jgi:hypothetical protein
MEPLVDTKNELNIHIYYFLAIFLKLSLKNSQYT